MKKKNVIIIIIITAERRRKIHGCGDDKRERDLGHCQSGKQK